VAWRQVESSVMRADGALAKEHVTACGISEDDWRYLLEGVELGAV